MRTRNEEILLTALRDFVTHWKRLDLKSPMKAEAHMIFQEVAKGAEAAIAKVQPAADAPETTEKRFKDVVTNPRRSSKLPADLQGDEST